MKETNHEIHMFLGKGRIDESSDDLIGEMRAFIFYLRQQKDTDYDFNCAEELLNEAGFTTWCSQKQES